MRTLSKNDWCVLAELLELASGEFAGRGYSDFKLPNIPENRSLAARIEEELGYESNVVSEDKEHIHLINWSAMDFFAHMARENADGN